MSLVIAHSLVSTGWLAAHLDDPDLAILDSAWTEWGQPGDTPVETSTGKRTSDR
jgi:3-mercaptopyruvate sulfurtransferase SseA